MDELEDEWFALQSIYPADSLQRIPIADDICSCRVIYHDDIYGFQLCFDLRTGYPAVPPTVHIHNVSRDHSTAIAAMTSDLLAQHSEQVVLFLLIEAVKQYFQERVPCPVTSAAPYPAINRENSITAEMESAEDVYAPSLLHIVHGPVTTEQKSSFQAHLAEVQNMDEVREFRAAVLSNRKVRRATHNIFAYRFTCPSTGVVYHDHDDDGETAAGGRLAELLRLMQIDGLAVIVSRWFGGILLGPDRFKFICNSARDLIEAEGFGERGKSRKGKRKNK